MEEIWKSLPVIRPMYISDKGRVAVIRMNEFTIIQPNINRGYCQIMLRVIDCEKSARVHRLVAKAFIPNPENKPTINHKNGIKTDNRIENLEWATQKENKVHAAQNGLTARGESHGFSKLKNSDIIQIRENLKAGQSAINVGKTFNVHPCTIHRIRNKEYWKHIL